MKVKVWYRLMAMAFLGLTLTACVDIFDNPERQWGVHEDGYPALL